MTGARPLPGRGLVLGKFLPPHLGHVYLIDFARRYVEHLTVVVGSLSSEPIPGDRRVAWMRELFPDVEVVHLADELPQAPEEHPDFWTLWRTSLARVLPALPDLVFASEAYGARLAEVLGARFVPVDPGRATVPVSATAIRAHPMRHWRFLPACVRPAFVKRVCLFGGESTGKTTLAGALAHAFDTVAVPEHARTLLEARGGALDSSAIPEIARGQLASEEALARQANRILICDTDLLLTTIWSDTLFGECPAWIRAEADRRPCDLYLLTDPDVPWIGDAVRYLPAPDARARFHQRCRDALTARGLRFIELHGPHQERFAAARAAIDDLV